MSTANKWEPYIHYTFREFLNKAKLESDRNDGVVFSELIYGAAVLCLKQFALVKFCTLLPSHDANIKFMDIVEKSFPDDENLTCASLVAAWSTAQICHRRLFNLEFIGKEHRENILQELDTMEENIRKMSIEKFNENYDNQQSLATHQKSGYMKINNVKYKYSYVAYVQ